MSKFTKVYVHTVHQPHPRTPSPNPKIPYDAKKVANLTFAKYRTHALIMLNVCPWPSMPVEYPDVDGKAGLADCYAVIVLADNATFLLAVNRIAAFR